MAFLCGFGFLVAQVVVQVSSPNLFFNLLQHLFPMKNAVVDMLSQPVYHHVLKINPWWYEKANANIRDVTFPIKSPNSPTD